MSLINALPQISKGIEKEYNKKTKKEFEVSEEVNFEKKENTESLKIKKTLCLGDNEAFLKTLIRQNDMAGKFNMIYIDPPFFSKANYDAVIKLESLEVASMPLIKHFAYEDTWEQGIEEYLVMLGVRLKLMKDLIADDGTIWVHLDWHVVHYVKILLDDIFGEKNFVNEIIWNYKSGGTSKKHFSRKHDTILVYSKTTKYFFNPLKEKSYNREFKPYRFKGVKEFKDEQGWYTMVNMKDVWQLNMVGRTSSERTGYATQKPESLLIRIIESCTREGDLCGDFFCGSGTLPMVCEKLNRRWIACDSGRLAIASTLKRLVSTGADFQVLESSPIKARNMGNVKITIKNEKLALTDMNHLTISLKKYMPKNTPEIVDENSREYIDELIKKDSLQLIEYWSVDYNYDGKIHRPEAMFVKTKGKIITFCEKLVKDENSISIKIVDVFGNCIYKVVKNH